MNFAIPQRIEVNQEELESILDKVKAHLTSDQYKILSSAIKMIVWLQVAIKEKSVTIAKLKYMFFGKKTESYKNIKKKTQDESKNTETPSQSSDRISTSTDDLENSSSHAEDNALTAPEPSQGNQKQRNERDMDEDHSTTMISQKSLASCTAL